MRTTLGAFKCDHCEAPAQQQEFRMARILIPRNSDATFDEYYELCDRCRRGLIDLIELWEQDEELPA